MSIQLSQGRSFLGTESGACRAQVLLIKAPKLIHRCTCLSVNAAILCSDFPLADLCIRCLKVIAKHLDQFTNFIAHRTSFILWLAILSTMSFFFPEVNFLCSYWTRQFFGETCIILRNSYNISNSLDAELERVITSMSLNEYYDTTVLTIASLHPHRFIFGMADGIRQVWAVVINWSQYENWSQKLHSIILQLAANGYHYGYHL